MSIKRTLIAAPMAESVRNVAYLQSNVLTSLELDDGLSLVRDLRMSAAGQVWTPRAATDLVVDNDLEVQCVIVHDSLDGF